MPRIVDEHPPSYWESSQYAAWLAALRSVSLGSVSPGSVSPMTGNARLDEPDLPEVARTETWGRRLSSTRLASWAQLRHDTLLYAKPS